MPTIIGNLDDTPAARGLKMSRIARHFPAANAAIQKLLNKHDTLQAGARLHPSEYNRTRAAVADDLNAVCQSKSDGESWDNDFQQAAEAVTEVISNLDLFASAAADERGMGGRSSRGGAGGGWINAQTGEPVRLYAHGEPLANTAAPGGLSTEGFLQGLVNPNIRQHLPAEFRNALESGSDAAGGVTVPSWHVKKIIDAMRAQMVLSAAGARTLPLEGKTTIARLASDPVPAWRAELGAISESEPTFDSILFEPKSLAVIVRVSRELCMDAMNLGEALLNSLAGAMARAVDYAGLYGPGTGNQPKGVAADAGITEIEMAENGAALAGYSQILAALLAVENANDQATAIIMNPREKFALAGLVDTTGQPLRSPEVVADLPKLSTTAMPIDETQGTAENASSIFAGNFGRLIIGVRESINLRWLNEVFASTGEYALVAHARVDFGLEQSGSFARIKGVIPA